MSIRENARVEAAAIWVLDRESKFHVVGAILFLVDLLLVFLSLPWPVLDAAAQRAPTLTAFVFAVPAAARWVLPDPPSVGAMSKDQILAHVLDSDLKDWESVSTRQARDVFFKDDPRLRFRIDHTPEGVHVENFREEWANRHPDSHATSYWCALYYDGNLIDRWVLVAVDGGRALLPLPDHKSKLVEPLGLKIAMINDNPGRVLEYLERSRLGVRD